MYRSMLLVPVVLALGATAAHADGVLWRSDIRESLAEAEDRGVPLLVYLSRDD